MALKFNGIEIDNEVKFNGINIDTVKINGVIVWETYTPGNVIIDYNAISGNNPETVTGANGSFAFTVPKGIRKVNICMCGGGASGVGRNYEYNNAGGSAGSIVSQEVTVTPLENVPITVGTGGAMTVDYHNPGGNTLFGALVAAGGPGNGNSPYYGNSGSRTSCGGTFTDGWNDSGAGGGQAGAFGNGGNGRAGGNGYNGGIGAGGGGVNDSRYSRGAGGNGRVRITW